MTTWRWCNDNQITFTRSRPNNSNDGAHVEQKNWHVVRQIVGYHRYDTTGELELLNRIWILQSKLTNFFNPQQKLIFKERHGAKLIKKHDVAQTPHQRAQHHQKITKRVKTALTRTYTKINPAAVQREIQALTAELLTLTTAKAGPQNRPAMRAHTSEATNQTRRAS